MVTIKELLNKYKNNSLQDNVSITDKLLGIVIGLLEKLVNKNKIKPYNSGPTNLPIAVIIQPNDVENIVPTNGGYTQINVEQILERKPDILYLINNGPGTIFGVVLHDITTSSQSEYQIFEGDRGTFYDVHELRIRATTINTEYIVTENELVRPKDVSFLRGNSYVSNQTLLPGGSITENVVTDPIQGLGRNSHTGYITDNGAGNLNVLLSYNGIKFTANPIPVLPNQILDLDKEDIYTVIISSVAGASYTLVTH